MRIILAFLLFGCFNNSQLIVEKIISNSVSFLEKPYISDPLGEGKSGKYDTDPTFRTDGFDCLTYVETVMAMSLSKNPNEIMNEIRYKDSKIAYKNRNHFMSADWIPNNVKNGYIEDITENFGENKIATTFIQKDKWAEKKKIHEFFGENKIASIPYISLKTIFKTPAILDKIPAGSIINIVRPNWNLEKIIGTNLNISHTGFLIKKENKIIFRHASATDKKIVDVELLKYLLQFKNSKSIKGINLLRISY
ncbi:MAG: N-acetylmuramoyl-L-alanine amidase-like domain-containing protein [Alphaproteobacteria bacterium]|nr:MAG: hypothetical protein B6I23_01805 [Rickettsiaceae bacterium 4572_127]